MKKNFTLLFLVFSLLFIPGRPFQAAAAEWEFDPIHSNFYFEIDHTYATVRGFFEDFSGTFRFAPDNLEESRIIFKVRTKSIDTNQRKRDNHLRTDEFFNVKKYPLMVFESNKISKSGEAEYKVEGELTIKDVTRDVILDMNYLGMQDNPLEPGQTIAGFESRLTLDRFDYNVGTGRFYDMGVVGREVDILVTLEMVRQD